MKAITVCQPYAWCIVYGGKTTENRTGFGHWRRAAGETIAIHAGQRLSDRGMADDRYLEATARAAVEPPFYGVAGFVFGAIIGTAHVTAVHAALADCCAPWGEHEYVEHGGRIRREIVHLVLDDVRPVVPVECRGQLGLWTVPDHIAAELKAGAA